MRRISDEMYDSIPGLLDAGMTTEAIAERFNVTPNSLKVMCSERGISLRRGSRIAPRLALSAEVTASLAAVAKATGRENSTRLVTDLLERIATDGLYRAILDEEVEQPA